MAILHTFVVTRPTTREREHQGQLVEVEKKMAAEAERARAEAKKQVAATREKADTLAAQLDLERHRAGELCQERDQALERLDRMQAEHHAELMVVREQMARAEHDHDRAATELAAHLALPWWRRLFA